MADVGPAEDGLLHLSFTSVVDKAFLCGLEVYSSRAGTARPVRLLAGARQYFDSRGTSGRRTLLPGRPAPDAQNCGEAGDESGLSASERWGNFTTRSRGARTVYHPLHFSESNFGLYDHGLRENRKGGAGDRLFDVYCNGEALVRKLDVYQEAGGADRMLVKTFAALSQTPRASCC